MASFEYSKAHSAYIKECSCCKIVFVGTQNQEESEEIFLRHFSPSNGSAQTADGLQSRCWICNSHRRRELGITRQSLEVLLQAQNYKCAICTKTITIERNAPPTIHAHVDHNDDTGKVRELLCGDCNRGIGLFKHNADILNKAADYICKHEPLPTTIEFRKRA